MHSNFEHLAVPLKGEHQALNCGIALAMLDRLRERGIDTPERFVAEGLAKTPANGRMEMAWHSPRIILDGAHTPESLEGLIRAIGAHVRYDSMVMIFGCAADKDVPGLLAKIDMGADKVIFTRAVDNPRASDPAELRREFEKTSTKMTQVADSLEEAVKIAVRATGRGDLIVVTGSFHLAGEAKRFLAERAARRTESKAAPAPQSARAQAGTTGS
ncbi:MAG: cyanophycin synthetase [Planctomycetota bacterium]